MEHITKKVMEMIRRKQVAPESSLFAFLRKYIPWLLVFIAVSFGAAATALIIFFLWNSDLDLMARFGGGFIIRSMPFFWICSFGLFLILSKFTYSKTTFGYRHGLLYVAALYLFATVVFGSLLSFAGFPQYVQLTVHGNRFVGGMMFNQMSVWSHPEEGLLAGKILSVDGTSITLLDFNNKDWSIDISGAIVRGRVSLEEGAEVKVVGKLSRDIFIAEDVRPWGARMGSGRGMGAGRGMMR